MSTPQTFEKIDDEIRTRFLALKANDPSRVARRLDLSWSNWGFGPEPLELSAARLEKAGLRHIELHGNRYGSSLGYRTTPTQAVLASHGLAVSGVCGMYSTDNDFASNSPSARQRAIDYTTRQLEFTEELDGSYLLIVPGAVGRPAAYDSSEWERSVDALQRASDAFGATAVKGAIEPIRRDEVSLVHSVRDALDYIADVDRPGVQSINGDVFHMQASEAHIAASVLEAGQRLVNLHMADSNRRALGSGAMDVDTIIRALYLIGHNAAGRFVTFEPLGPGASPYEAMWTRQPAEQLDRLVTDSVAYFREREEAVLTDG